MKKHTWADVMTIRLYALPEGLCQMADRGRYLREQVIDLSEIERARAVIRRLMDEAAGRKEYGTYFVNQSP